MYLVSVLESDDNPPETKMRLCAIANCALELRGAVSLFSRVSIAGEDLMALKGHCQRFFNVVSTLLQSVNPTVWTIGYVVRSIKLVWALIACKAEKLSM